MPEFEVLLISIDWESPNRVRTIVPSKKFLEASKIDGNKYEYDIVLYNKEDDLYFQFAVKTKHTTFLKTNDGNWNQNSRLYNIQDDLWIIKGDWRTGQRGISYHHCPSINTIGKIEIGISENLTQIQQFVTIDINSNIEDFDFDQLKNDFEGELWNLITSKKSLVTVDKIEFKYGDKTIRFPENKFIMDFLTEFDKISNNPKRELTHTKEFRRIEKVIPIAETYRKLSTAGTTTLLPSKAVLENHDIYENKFVCFMLSSIHLIVSKNIKYTSLQIERLQNEINVLNETIIQIQKPQIITEEKVLKEIQDQELKIFESENKWKIISSGLTFLKSANYITKSVNLWKEHNELPNTYWSYIPEFCLITFPELMSEYLKEGATFKVEVINPNEKKSKTKKGKEYQIIQNFDIRSIEGSETALEQNILLKQKQNAEILRSNNWIKLLTVNEKNEQINQIQTLRKRIDKIKFQIKNIAKFIEEQSELQPLIEQKLKTNFFKKVKWKNFQGFKPSMTFIQNITYRNALRYYKEILKSEGIDIAVFDLYENVTAVGLREMPQVYELWCLVTIIKVLEESFYFAHISKDLSTLLKTIDPKKQTIAEYSKIDFKNSLAGRGVTLHYQKSIAENKRPDFILEVTCNRRTINLVLDSKFKNYNYKKSIVYETVDMTNKYGGSVNYVFIFHPCQDGNFNNKKVRYTNHGGDKIYIGEGKEQQIKFPFHEYGYIELKPNFTYNLKKLIAMSFEYLLEPSRIAEDKNPKPENEMFCINCGNDKFAIDEGSYRSGGKFYKYSCIAEDNNQNKICGHEVNISYCWNCKTKLFKHGSYWDYHLESTWSIFDIRCPNCGMTVADRPNT